MDIDLQQTGLPGYGAEEEVITKLRTWDVLLTDLEVGAHTPRSVLHVSQDIDDGFHATEAGTYELSVKFTVEAVSAATPTPTVLDIDQEGLVAYFPFDDDAKDASGNGHHGMVHGATLTTDRNGEDEKAYNFDGVNNFISVMDSPDFDIGVGDMTVLSWVFYEAGESRFKGLISHTNGVEVNDGWWWALGKGRVYMLVCMADNDPEYSPAAPKNTWVHLAFVKSGSEVTFYVDGTAQGNPIDHGMNINDSDGNLRIGMEGSTYGGHFFLGKIDDMRFNNRALTADEILVTVGAQE